MAKSRSPKRAAANPAKNPVARATGSAIPSSTSGGGVGELIRSLCAQSNFTQDALAAAIGCSKAQLSLMLNNRRTITLDWARKMETALRVAPGSIVAAIQWQSVPPALRDELDQSRTHSNAIASRIRHALASKNPLKALRQLVDANSPNVEEPLPIKNFRGRGRGIPVINNIAAGYPTEFTDLDYPAAVADEYIACPDITDPDAFAARVVGDSMEPDYREGDIVVFSPQLPTPSGTDCFVRFERDSHTTFKRIYVEADERSIRLQPLNNTYAPQVVDREAIAGMYAASYVMRRVKTDRTTA